MGHAVAWRGKTRLHYILRGSKYNLGTQRVTGAGVNGVSGVEGPTVDAGTHTFSHSH